MATDLIRKVSDPFEREFGREMTALRNFTDRLWDTPFMPMRWLREVNPFEMDLPAADVEEKNDQYVVKAALPGWKPENVNITYEPGLVTIEGKFDEETEQKGDGKYHRKEIMHKSFTRSFSLPGEVKLDKAGAEFKDGLLTISLPKSEVVKPRQIKIAANGK
jgi:HSP20 family protein